MYYSSWNSHQAKDGVLSPQDALTKDPWFWAKSHSSLSGSRIQKLRNITLIRPFRNYYLTRKHSSYSFATTTRGVLWVWIKPSLKTHSISQIQTAMSLKLMAYCPLHSRLNHSCIPNLKIPTIDGEIISSFVTRDIDAGEEINFCYNTDFAGRTRYERHQARRSACGCIACLPGTPFQLLSNMRRWWIRGLQYLTQDVDLDGQRQSSHSAILVDSKLKIAEETFSIPLSSKLAYTLFSIVLLEEEGLLDDLMVEN